VAFTMPFRRKQTKNERHTAKERERSDNLQMATGILKMEHLKLLVEKEGRMVLMLFPVILLVAGVYLLYPHIVSWVAAPALFFWHPGRGLKPLLMIGLAWYVQPASSGSKWWRLGIACLAGVMLHLGCFLLHGLLVVNNYTIARPFQHVERLAAALRAREARMPTGGSVAHAPGGCGRSSTRSARSSYSSSLSEAGSFSIEAVNFRTEAADAPRLSTAKSAGAPVQPALAPTRVAGPLPGHLGAGPPPEPPTYVLESAAVDPIQSSDLPDGRPLPASVLYQQLASNFSRRHLILVAVASSWFAWDGLAREFALPDMRVVGFGASIYLAGIVSAASFPVQLNSPAGIYFMRRPMQIAGLTACVNMFTNYPRSLMHTNAACSQVYSFTVAIQLGVWLCFALSATRGLLTWRLGRTLLTIDGVSFLLCTLVCHAIGPPAAYAPGNVSFGASIVRGFYSLVLSAGLALRIRLRIAASASRLGWNHVTVDLKEF